MRKIINTCILSAIIVPVFILCGSCMTVNTDAVAANTFNIEQPTFNYEVIKLPSISTTEEPIKEEAQMTDKDIKLIALATMAEAEGECEEGKRLVIDTILNRVDSEYFPDTVQDVIYQPHQFSSMWNGRVERCEVREDICQLVKEEVKSRTNHNVMFFTAGGYSNYGTPMFQVEDHYFSSYD